MWLLLFLTTIFTLISQIMMSYLVLHSSIGPWVGPLLVVVCMTLLMPFISKKWFSDHAIITIAASSVGGMIGLCLGKTLPAFYFLQKTEFLMWLKNPVLFSAVISFFVLSAGGLGFLIVYLIKDHFINEERLLFPMSNLVHDIVSVEKYSDLHRFMWMGIAISSFWNGIIFITRSIVHGLLAQIQMIPMLISIGFVAGHEITVPIVIGFLNRLLAIDLVHMYYFKYVQTTEFLIMFCLGMLSVTFVKTIIQLLMNYGLIQLFDITAIKSRMLSPLFMIIGSVVTVMSGVLLYMCGVSGVQASIVFCIAIPIGINVAKVVGEIGIIDIDGFVWCILLPFLYGSTVSSMHLLVIIVFVTIFLGVIVDLIFSYKLTTLSSMPYPYVLRYQTVAFFIAIVTSGFMMWLYAQNFNEDSLQLFAFDAQTFEEIINFGKINYGVLSCGILSGLIVSFTNVPILAVVGATLMSPSTSVWLVLAGATSYIVSDHKKLYPLWFGIYAAGAVWMVILAIL